MFESSCSLLLLLTIISVYPGVTRSSSCGGTFSQTDKGTVWSPRNQGRYGNHQFCNYAIKVASNKQVRITFREVMLTRVLNTLPEYVVLLDGPDCMAERIHVMHSTANPTVVTSNNALTALFVSDLAAGSGKFKADYLAVTGQNVTVPIPPFEGNQILYNCGGEKKGNYGRLYYKGNGTRNALCIWRITVENGRRVYIRFSMIKLDSPLAWLRVFDGKDCAADEMKFIAEDEDKESVNLISTSNVMTVVYASAEGKEDAVVEATYWDGTTTSAEPGITIPRLPGDLETDAENLANNPAGRNTFDLLASSAACILAGALLLLLNMR